MATVVPLALLLEPQLKSLTMSPKPVALTPRFWLFFSKKSRALLPINGLSTSNFNMQQDSHAPTQLRAIQLTRVSFIKSTTQRASLRYTKHFQIATITVRDVLISLNGIQIMHAELVRSTFKTKQPPLFISTPHIAQTPRHSITFMAPVMAAVATATVISGVSSLIGLGVQKVLKFVVP
ncbi:hypothetical protein FQZ97_936790 [compost metagenome]